MLLGILGGSKNLNLNMMKKFLITITLFASLYCVNAQSLSISETVNYINKTFRENNSPDRIELQKDGIFRSYNYNTRMTAIMHVSEVEVRSFSDESFYLTCFDVDGRKSKNNYSIQKPPYQCKCIRYEFETNKPANNLDFQYVYALNDPYKTKKLCNAFRYLFDLIQEDGSYIRDDADPFAPNNFKLKGNDIKGNMANTNIKLESDGGVYHTFVTIGNIKKLFVVDSGASDVTLSEDFEKELINTGIIKKGYYISSALYTLADGSIILCRRLILPELTVGAYTVTNVKAVIVGNSSPLLLGRSFFDKFKKWSIDNSTNILSLEK